MHWLIRNINTPCLCFPGTRIFLICSKDLHVSKRQIGFASVRSYYLYGASEHSVRLSNTILLFSDAIQSAPPVWPWAETSRNQVNALLII